MWYTYFKDVERETYPNDEGKPMRHPNEARDEGLTLTISGSDLDEHGIYYLKDLQDPNKVMMFVASSIRFNAN